MELVLVSNSDLALTCFVMLREPTACHVLCYPWESSKVALVLLGGDETQGVTTAQAWGAVISETASEKFEYDGGI